MNDMSDRRILIVEDDDHWYEIIAEAIQEALYDLGCEADYKVMHARYYQQALDLLKSSVFTLVSMDVNLSDVSKGTSEGLDLLEYLSTSTFDTCSIIVSGEAEPEYILDGFQKYNILRYIKKAPWDNQELSNTVKSILLYADALGYLKTGEWKKAIENWERACKVMPELRKRFQDVGGLVERAKSEVTNPITGLPTGEMVDSKLRGLLRASKPWGILYIVVDNLEEYYKTYGHVEGDSALKIIGLFLQDQADQASFIGYIERDLFMVIVGDHLYAESLKESLRDNFNLKRDMDTNLYSFRDREKGVGETGIPELKLAIRLVSDQDGPFTDIRELSRMGSGSSFRD